jgi:hypothetical protein
LRTEQLHAAIKQGTLRICINFGYIDFRYISGLEISDILSLATLYVSKRNKKTVQHKYTNEVKYMKYVKQVINSKSNTSTICLSSISLEPLKKQPRGKKPNLRCAQIEIAAENVSSTESNLQNNCFNRFLLEAVDEGLSLIGKSAKQAVYFHLEKNFNITRDDVPQRIEEFANALEKMFGLGAKMIEIQIMKKLYEKIGNSEYVLKQDDVVFTEYIAALRKYYCHSIFMSI